MRPFRKNVALAVDGGGIKGAMVARALAVLEAHLGKALSNVFHLTAGTSTGGIISAGIAAGVDAESMHRLYSELGKTIFAPSLRCALWPLTRYRYPHGPLAQALYDHLADVTMGELWTQRTRVDLVITAFDLVTNHTCFIKPWKPKYESWSVVDAVLASCSVPTYFPPVAGRYVDGGVGAYANPCYIAAYESAVCLEWDASETTLISLGTGRDPRFLKPGDADRFWAWHWLKPMLGAFLGSADDQQVHLVTTFFNELDFRRFQVDLWEPIAMDDPSKIRELSRYGDELGRKILADETDRAMDIVPITLGEAMRRRGGR